MKIKKEIYSQIINRCPVVPPEVGGIIGMKNGVVSVVEFDFLNIIHDFAQYIPDTESINKTIRLWDKKGFDFCGMFHSHMYNQKTLSNEDKRYIEEIMRLMPEKTEVLYFPVIMPKQKIISYKAEKKNHSILILNDIIEIV